MNATDQTRAREVLNAQIASLVHLRDIATDQDEIDQVEDELDDLVERLRNVR